MSRPIKKYNFDNNQDNKKNWADVSTFCKSVWYSLDNLMTRIESLEATTSSISCKYNVSENSSNLVFANATSEIIDYDLKEYDPYNMVTVGESWSFSPFNDGKYFFNIILMWNSSALWSGNETSVLQVFKNGTQVLQNVNGSRSPAGTDSPLVQSAGFSFALVKQDVIQVKATQNVGNNLALASDATGLYNSITIFRIGD